MRNFNINANNLSPADREQAFDWALCFLQAEPADAAGSFWVYYDDATRSRWRVRYLDLVELGRRVLADVFASEADIYSHWCSETSAEEVDEGDEGDEADEG